MGVGASHGPAPWDPPHGKVFAVDIVEPVLNLSKDVRTFLTKIDDFDQFDLDGDIEPILQGALTADPRLSQWLPKLVPKRVSEEQFWKNYFSHVIAIKSKVTLIEIKRHTNGSESDASHLVLNGSHNSRSASGDRSYKSRTKSSSSPYKSNHANANNNKSNSNRGSEKHAPTFQTITSSLRPVDIAAASLTSSSITLASKTNRYITWVEPKDPVDVLKGSQNIKWGIIGCGDVCQVKSGPALYKCIGSELVAVMRRDEAKAKAFALKHKVARYYTNYKDLIKDKEVNAIYIASPPGSHADIAMACALAGKPCLVEKPIARSGHEATAVVNTFKDLNVPLFVAYYRRAHHRFITAKHIIATHLGQVTSVSVAFSTPTQLKYSSKELGWRISPELSGGGLFMDVGCHTLDILDFLLGSLGHVNGDAVYFPSPLDKDGENKVSNGSSNSSNGKGGVNTRHHHIGNNSSNNGSHTDSGSNSSSSGNGHSSSGKGNSSHITHNNNNNSSNSNVKVENLVAMSFRLPNGAIGSAQWNFLSAQSEDLLTIYGTKGKLTMSVFGSDSPLLVTDSGERVEFKTKYPQHAHQPLVQSIINELRLSRSGVSSNKAGHICESKGTSALRTNIVMDAVLRKFYRNRNDQFWTRPETYSL